MTSPERSPPPPLVLAFILGWNLRPDELLLFLELRVPHDHPRYRPPRKDEADCFRLAVARARDVQELSGITGTRMPQWDEVGEFNDIDEINEAELTETRWILRGDELNISLTARSFELVFVEDETVDAFEDFR